jgi:Family of unknown function (DUF6335)
MAKRKAARRAAPAKSAQKGSNARSAPRASAKRSTKRQASARKKARAQKSSRKTQAGSSTSRKSSTRPKPKSAAKVAKKRSSSASVPIKKAKLDRVRRTLAETETHTTPPSSLDMVRQGSAARTGRAEIAQNIREHHGMNGVTGGDPDVDIDDAYFTGEEAPGGDNPTPDQDIVEDIGKSLGVTYDDSEELKGANKLEQRDKHRWELDPASSEDYKERK